MIISMIQLLTGPRMLKPNYKHATAHRYCGYLAITCACVSAVALFAMLALGMTISKGEAMAAGFFGVAFLFSGKCSVFVMSHGCVNSWIVVFLFWG